MMINRLIQKLSTLLILLAGLALVMMMLHVTLDVAAKYLIKFPIPGTAEIVAAYYMISVVFLPLAYIEIHDRSIVVEMLYDHFPQKLKAFADIIGAVISIFIFGFLAYLGFNLAWEAWEIREYVDGLWRVVVWPSRFLIPLGLTVACAAVMLRLVLLIQMKRNPVVSASLGKE